MKQRTGLIAFWKGYDRKLYLKAAILADKLGYDSFWLPEVWGYESFQLLTEIAIHTKRIKLATGIVNAFSRSPALIGMSVATLDEISEGRVILGIGTSGKKVIEGFHARQFRKPLTQTRDVIRVTRGAPRGDAAQRVRGEAERVPQVHLGPETVSPARPDLRRRAQAEVHPEHR